MHRMLKPGGVACVSDDDWSTVVFSPADPLVEQQWEIAVRLIQHSGGNPFYARHLRGLMQGVGFTRVAGHAIAADHYGTLAATRTQARFVESVLSIPTVREMILSEGWADEGEIEQIRAGYVAWGEQPDTFLAWMYCAVVGWVSEDMAE